MKEDKAERGRLMRMPCARVAARRQKVKEYLLKGYTQREIASALGVSLGTVNSDVAAVYGDVVDALHGSTALRIIEDIVSEIRAEEREAWTMFEEADSELCKLEALEKAENARGRLLDVLQRLEVAKKAREAREGCSIGRMSRGDVDGRCGSETPHL